MRSAKKREPTMKKFAMLRTISAFVAIITCLSCLWALPAYAEDQTAAEEETTDAEYEAKKAAYREKLMSDDVTSDNFLIGSWVSFYSFDVHSYEYQLDQMAAAGINFNIFPKNFGGGAMYDAAYWEDVETQYAKRNMVYLMNGNVYEVNVAPGVEYAKGKEHCIGYHVADEPRASMLEHIGYITDRYYEKDPSRFAFCNLYPSYAPSDRLEGTYYDYVSKYVSEVGADKVGYLSHDYYPFLEGGTTRAKIFTDMEVIRKVAYENGKLKTHAFPQSTAWTGTRMPNEVEMRYNVYGYLAYGFKALSWFNLVCPGSSDTEGEGFYDSLIYRDGTIRDPELFAFWSELNWEVRGMSDILMNQDVVHAYHIQKNVKDVEYLPGDFFLKPYGQYDLIVSVMEPKTGDDQYIMLFSKKLDRNITAKFKVASDSGVKWMEYFDPHTGEYIPMEIKNSTFSDSFLPGEGKLYRLRYDAPPAELEEPTETEAITETETETETKSDTEFGETVAETATAEITTETSVASETEFSTTNEATSEETPGTDAATSNGCGSAITPGAVTIVLMSAAVIMRKKDE